MTSNVLDLDATASQVFVAIGGQHFNVVGAWTAATGVREWWHGAVANDQLDGDVQAILHDGGTVYFGFHGGYNGSNALRLMAASASTGALDPDFRPTTNGISGVEDIVSDGGVLAAVGDFSTSGGVPLDGVALFPASGGGGTTTTAPVVAPSGGRPATGPTTPPAPAPSGSAAPIVAP